MESSARKGNRVWAALIAFPFVLGVVFGCFGGYFAVARGLRDDALMRAIQGIVAWPTTIAFALGFLLTRRLAERDGFSLPALGWTKPAAMDVVTGLGAAGVLWAVNAWVLHPWLRTAQPDFDPTLKAVALPAAVVMMGMAVVAEDSLYRGYAFLVLRSRYGVAATVVITTVFYVFLTPAPGWGLKLWAAYFGTVLCGLRLWRGNLWSGAIAHFVVALGPRFVLAWTG